MRLFVSLSCNECDFYFLGILDFYPIHMVYNIGWNFAMVAWSIVGDDLKQTENSL